MLPFARNDATRYISPTKTPEYLAAGKPVVSTSIRDVVRPYGQQGLARIADTVDDFVAAIEAALRRGSGRAAARRRCLPHAHVVGRHLDADAAAGRTGDRATQAPQRRITRVTRRRRGNPSVRLHDHRCRVRRLCPGGAAGGGLGKKVLLVDKRPHIGGNAYDYHDEHGILIHKYGPHIFHTNSREVFNYLSRFTEWHPYQHRVRAWVDGRLVPIPINLDTINTLYGTSFNSFQLGEFYKSVAEPRAELKTSEDVILNQVGRELYEKFFRNYTRKQWGLDPSELDAAVTARVPTRTNRDDRYFTDAYQAMPLRGYTRMFERMLDHPNIKILLNTDYHEIEGSVLYDEVICTGPIDEFFDYRFGKLPYRSLQFQWETLEHRAGAAGRGDQLPERQPVHPRHRVQAPHRPDSTPRRRGSTSIRRRRAIRTIRSRAPENAALYKQYQELGAATPGVHFVGRLGTYRYYNMDQVVAQALTTYSKIAGVRRAESREVVTMPDMTAIRALGRHRMHDQPGRRPVRRSA